MWKFVSVSEGEVDIVMEEKKLCFSHIRVYGLRKQMCSETTLDWKDIWIKSESGYPSVYLLNLSFILSLSPSSHTPLSL